MQLALEFCICRSTVIYTTLTIIELCLSSNSLLSDCTTVVVCSLAVEKYVFSAFDRSLDLHTYVNWQQRRL